MQIQTDDELSLKVTARALLQRINRKLRGRAKKLCKSSSHELQCGNGFGEYHLVATDRNELLEYSVDLVEMARKIGVMHPCEKLAV